MSARAVAALPPLGDRSSWPPSPTPNPATAPEYWANAQAWPYAPRPAGPRVTASPLVRQPARDARALPIPAPSRTRRWPAAASPRAGATGSAGGWWSPRGRPGSGAAREVLALGGGWRTSCGRARRMPRLALSPSRTPSSGRTEPARMARAVYARLPDPPSAEGSGAATRREQSRWATNSRVLLRRTSAMYSRRGSRAAGLRWWTSLAPGSIQSVPTSASCSATSASSIYA